MVSTKKKNPIFLTYSPAFGTSQHITETLAIFITAPCATPELWSQCGCLVAILESLASPLAVQWVCPTILFWPTLSMLHRGSARTLSPLCTDNTWCTEDERWKQITCHGVRKQLWQWMLQIPVCMACTRGPEWGLCVGNSLAPVSASVPLNPLLKPSFPEQVLMSAACTHGNLSGFPQKEAVPSSPVDSVLQPSPCAAWAHSSVAADLCRSAQSSAFQR